MAKGIRYEYDYNLENAKKDLTLEGDITFDGISYSDYTQCADLYIPALADINLHLNNLETRNITMSAPDSNKPSIICDSDYSSYFKNVKYENITKEVEFLDNSDTFVLSGVYSARIPQKIRNNIVQNEISRVVEPLNFYLKDKHIYFQNPSTPDISYQVYL